ncbi:MAG: DUF6786 family protein [Terrimicrobiaceae bacterium]
MPPHSCRIDCACHRTSGKPPGDKFSGDLEFLRKHAEVVVLTDKSGNSQVAVAPTWQGRVMTSTASGPNGTSFGWVNRALIASGKIQPHINAFGGEDRFWLGPEGGQFSIFFAKGVPFDLKHWFTPASLDTEPFHVADKTASSVVCKRTIALSNYSGTPFSLEVTRKIRLVNPDSTLSKHGIKRSPETQSVAFESVNTIKNTGKQAWVKETGLLSIWILGMFNASPNAVIIVPFEKGPKSERGPIVNDAYFGKVPADRLVVKDNVLFFRADADYRSKIGISSRRVKPLLGSYDSTTRTLTLVEFTYSSHAADYVNSMWKLQAHPFGGDVLNSYNDGPQKPGGERMGKFFEMESSSPALALKPGATATHVHRTIHLQGSEKDLDAIARATLGVSLVQIKNAFIK